MNFSFGPMLCVALVQYQPNTSLYYYFQGKLFHGICIVKQLHVRNIASALY